jgi:hypothetical protein
MNQELTEAFMRGKVRALEAHILTIPQVDLKTQMLSHARMGVRTIFLKKGTALTGALTNIANVCIVSGDISVTFENGVRRITGFHVLTAPAGFKRAGYAHEDTWWTTIWHTDKTDSRDMEDEMTSESEMLQTRRAGIVFEQTEVLE